MTDKESSPPTKVGLGLVEVSALSTLIGSVTTELLTLGERGAAGLPWAALSAFGSLSIVRACIAAVTPAWLRESIGARSTTADDALGMALCLNRKLVSRDNICRQSSGEPIGVACSGSKRAIDAKTRNHLDCEMFLIEARDVYVFDRATRNPLSSIPMTSVGFPFGAHLLRNDPDYVDPVIKLDWFGLATSMSKLVEAIVLWIQGARWVAIIGSSCWLYFLICGTLLQLCRQSRGYAERPGCSYMDVITGQLPTPNKAGGDRKFVFQATPNYRNTMLWTVVWLGGALVATTSVTTMYVILARQPPEVTYVWLGFQALWLILRSGYFHVSQGPNTTRNPLVIALSIKQTDAGIRRRLLDLANAVSMFQMHVHPRGLYAYDDDIVTSAPLCGDFLGVLKNAETELDIGKYSFDKMIVFKGVIGDTLLSSLTWFHGSKLSGSDLYDSCIVILKLADKVLAVPSARVLCAIARAQADVESGRVLKNVPKGSFNWGRDTVKWIYWIPCIDGCWIQACSKDLKILGVKELQIVTDADITRVLQTGEVNVSHTHVDDVRKVVEHSQVATQVLQEFLEG